MKPRASGQEIRDGEKRRAQIFTKDITVQQGDQISVFPLKQAKWSKRICAEPFKTQRKPATVPMPRCRNLLSRMVFRETCMSKVVLAHSSSRLAGHIVCRRMNYRCPPQRLT